MIEAAKQTTIVWTNYAAMIAIIK